MSFSVGIILRVSSNHSMTLIPCAWQLPRRLDDDGSDSDIMVPAEEIVLASDCKWTNCVLDTVVVNAISAVQDIAAQAWKERIGVSQHPAHQGLRRELS